MVNYEKMSGPETSDRAPTGVCELSIQAHTNRAFDYGPGLQEAMDNFVTQGINVQSYEYEDDNRTNMVAIYTGSDRLDIATLRDIAEVYANYTEFPGGNVPPNLTLLPTTEENTDDTTFAWFEFKLEGELPEAEVKARFKDAVGECPIEGKNPVGEESQAILFRDGNYSHHQVREVLNRASRINDNLPIDRMQIVCETAEPYTE